MTPKRPALRYHGGKWLLAPWVLQFFPRHEIYVEPFGGGGSVLLRKPRVHAEIYNDLDCEVVNVFRVLRDPEQAAALRHALVLTPFAREEFLAAHRRDTTDRVELARRAIVRSFMGFGTSSLHARAARGMRTRASRWEIRHSTGFRSESHGNGTTPAGDWAHWTDHIHAITERLRAVVIENRDALDVIRQHDRPGCLTYADPPYVTSTRGDDRPDYSHEMTDDDHRRLAEVLRAAKGFVVLSGYPSALYDELFAGWQRFEREHRAHDAKKRTEVLWINDACADALGRHGLFGVAQDAGGSP